MEFRLKNLKLVESKRELAALPEGKLLINTINAHSYNTALEDSKFAEALLGGDALIPDGASIVKACRWLGAKSLPVERVAGWDLFEFEMGRLNAKGGRCMFMGSSPKVLGLIVERARALYPNIEVVTYSPPYKPEFSPEENRAIVDAINAADPDLLWIGMTAPKHGTAPVSFRRSGGSTSGNCGPSTRRRIPISCGWRMIFAHSTTSRSNSAASAPGI